MSVVCAKNKLAYSKIFIPISMVIYTNSAISEDIFDINAINTGIESQVADVNSLGYLSQVGGQLPGTYYVDIYINNNLVVNKSITFVYDDKIKKLIPEVTKKMLLEWGVKNSVSQEFSDMSENEYVKNIETLIPSAKLGYHFEVNQLQLSIPQIGLENTSRGYVEPNEWDDGINAAFVNYTARYNKYWYKDRDNNNNSFLGLRSGINLNAWRLRNHSTYSKTMDESHWNNLQTYLERDIRTLKSRLTIGETSSDNGVMESNPFRGVRLASDESMLPQSQRGFAPVVTGIAQTNAIVTVRQNGNVIYQTTVPPGEFSINDLYPTSYSGDLDVTIEETNGTTRSFIQPFSAVPMMQRAGALKYSLDIGKYNVDNARRKPNFAQASAIYGLPYNMSIYGGFLVSADYQAYTMGTGVNLGNIGAISTDITQASTTLIDKTKADGQSYRVQYSKYLPGTGTSFSLASYRYSTKNYYDFSSSNNYFYDIGRKKQQFQASISQSLDGIGYFSVNGYQQYYWDKGGSDKNLTMSFSSNYNAMNYSVAYSYMKQDYSNTNDQMLSVNLSIPFDIGQKNNWVNYSYNTSRKGDSTSSLSFNGTRLEDNNLQYDITQRYNHSRNEYSNSVSANYIISAGEYSAGYNYDPKYNSVDLGATGALLLHSGGITASRTIYDSAVLVKAEDIDNLKVNNAQALYTDASGYAVIPTVTRYERNKVSVDTATLTGNNDVAINTTTVVPTQGAIVLANFQAKRGARILLRLMNKGKPIAFGTQVFVFEKDNQVTSGIVANDGEVYLSGVPEQSVIKVKWGNNQTQQCTVPLLLSLESDKIQFIERVCE
ncbi:fimbria/pilus outer membrane usher protein [Providencia vermicola]|uniref:fimbria/pilus outer membrane usher protein n=1 Tax=Providencia vermicola TaxID=333965 RepID=UPI0032DA78E7